MARKICHLLVAFGNKNQSYTTNLLEKINRFSKHEHFVFCHKNYCKSSQIRIFNSHRQNRIVSIFKYVLLYIKDSHFRQLTKNFTRREKYKWIQLLQLNFDVIHVHHAHAISYDVLLYLAKKNIKIIVSLRGRDLLVDTIINSNFQQLQKKLELASKIHSISDFMQKELLKTYGFNSNVIYRGQHRPKVENIKKSKHKTNEIRIIAVGRLVWEKGHVYILETIFRLKKRGVRLIIDIYGVGDLEDFLIFRIKQLEIKDEVNLKGYVNNDRLKKLYKNYDIAVQPSISEALSNGLIDLMLHNLPCVITNVGGMPEIIKHNKNGIVISATKMTSLDEAILQALKLNMGDLKKFNCSWRKKFSIQKELRSFEKLYSETLKD